MDDKQEDKSAHVLKCGKRTYFFDVKEASNGNNYLRVTESRFVKEGERRRNTLTLFKDDLEEFMKKLDTAGSDL